MSESNEKWGNFAHATSSEFAQRPHVPQFHVQQSLVAEIDILRGKRKNIDSAIRELKLTLARFEELGGLSGNSDLP